MGGGLPAGVTLLLCVVAGSCELPRHGSFRRPDGSADVDDRDPPDADRPDAPDADRPDTLFDGRDAAARPIDGMVPVDATVTDVDDGRPDGAVPMDTGLDVPGPSVVDMDCTPAGACACPPLAHCFLRCEEGGCDVRCGAGSVCEVDCRGGSCLLVCAPGASCDLICAGPGRCDTRCEGALCRQGCGAAPDCTMSCEAAGDCDQTCDEGCSLTCDDDSACRQRCGTRCSCSGCTATLQIE